MFLSCTFALRSSCGRYAACRHWYAGGVGCGVSGAPRMRFAVVVVARLVIPMLWLVLMYWFAWHVRKGVACCGAHVPSEKMSSNFSFSIGPNITNVKVSALLARYLLTNRETEV